MEIREIQDMIYNLHMSERYNPMASETIDFLKKIMHKDILLIDSNKLKSKLREKKDDHYAYINNPLGCVTYGVELHIMNTHMVNNYEYNSIVSEEEKRKFDEYIFKELKEQFRYGFEHLLGIDKGINYDDK